MTDIATPELGEDATKVTDQIAALKLMAQIKGWMAPEKIAPTTGGGPGLIYWDGMPRPSTGFNLSGRGLLHRAAYR